MSTAAYGMRWKKDDIENILVAEKDGLIKPLAVLDPAKNLIPYLTSATSPLRLITPQAFFMGII